MNEIENQFQYQNQNNPYIYYKDQCKCCLKKGKCFYQKDNPPESFD